MAAGAIQENSGTTTRIVRRGGVRAGAGRPRRVLRPAVAHRARHVHQARFPVHVTLRTTCRSLRTQYVFPTVRIAIAATNRAMKDHFRICEFSVQGDHIHLLVEAENTTELTRGMKSLACRLAYHVNRLLSQRGRFTAGRFHSRDLETPRAVRNALVYVLGNFRKHGRRQGRVCSSPLDVFSSAPYFLGFRGLRGRSPLDHRPGLIPRSLAPPDAVPVERGTTWLLSQGWVQLGFISLNEAPKS